MCVGTFTYGHVKPPALDEFIRITKNNGLICFTINEGIHEEYGFDKKIIELNQKNKDTFFYHFKCLPRMICGKYFRKLKKLVLYSKNSIFFFKPINRKPNSYCSTKEQRK